MPSLAFFIPKSGKHKQISRKGKKSRNIIKILYLWHTQWFSEPTKSE